MKTKIACMAVLGLMVFPSLAHAQTDTTTTNNDYKSCPYLEERFSAADTNNDGSLSKEEFVTARTRQINRTFDRLDNNNDGKISKEEFDDACERMHRGRSRMEERRMEERNRGKE